MQEIFEYTSFELVNKSFKKILNHKGQLSIHTMNALMNCIKKIEDDVSDKHYELIFEKKRAKRKSKI